MYSCGLCVIGTPGRVLSGRGLAGSVEEAASAVCDKVLVFEQSREGGLGFQETRGKSEEKFVCGALCFFLVLRGKS